MIIGLVPLALASALAALLAAASRVQGRRDPTPATGALTAAQRDDLLLTLAAWATFAVVVVLAFAVLSRPLVIVGLAPGLLLSAAPMAQRLDRQDLRRLAGLKVVAALGIAACGLALWIGG